MGTVFRFKQFEVDQRECAMKINTDGVLLGSIVSFESPSFILDIGSGTGVIGLMLAQRFDKAQVDAVEIDEAAYLRSKENFSNSIFSDRLTAFHHSFEKLSPTYSYDLIVSNPPFYTNSLHNPDEKKKIARHTDFEFFSTLLTFSFSKLSENGSLQLILPSDLAIEVVEKAINIGFCLKKRINIRSFEESESIRQIIDLTKQDFSDTLEVDFVIYKSKGEYSDDYKRLLSPFFLAY